MISGAATAFPMLYFALAGAPSMIELTIPGRGTIRLQHLVSDVNGTLALDGRLIDGVAEALLGLRDRLDLHLLTADTHRRQADIDRQLGLTGIRVPPGDEAATKAVYVRRLGSEHVVALGNGANDAAMLYEAAIGIAILSPEGLSTDAAQAADLMAPTVLDALGWLERPMRLVASLRR
jgi:P-type E1-E2 ATPase